MGHSTRQLPLSDEAESAQGPIILKVTWRLDRDSDTIESESMIYAERGEGALSTTEFAGSLQEGWAFAEGAWLVQRIKHAWSLQSPF